MTLSCREIARDHRILTSVVPSRLVVLTVTLLESLLAWGRLARQLLTVRVLVWMKNPKKSKKPLELLYGDGRES